MRFGGVTAVDNVNFKLRARELRCLIGPNGAGKSTFFKCVCGLLRPTEGHIYMRGRETTDRPAHEIASLGVGVKMQTPSVMESLSVRENIWLSAGRFHAGAGARRKTSEVIEKLALAPLASSELSRLAHGERQRAELGMVAAGDPWLVLLDEPAAGMSAGDIGKITEIIRELRRTSAVVIVEHDMQFIRAVAETVTVFHQGAVLTQDSVDRVMENPAVRDVYLGKNA